MRQTILTLTELHPSGAPEPDILRQAVAAWLARELSK